MLPDGLFRNEHLLHYAQCMVMVATYVLGLVLLAAAVGGWCMPAAWQSS
jgi:hypothetical protein